MRKIRDLIHKVDPYEFLTVIPNLDLDGWNGDSEVIVSLVKEVQPKIALEVGSWKGQSAATIATNMPEGSELVCIDTWLGAEEFWTNHDDPTRYQALKLINGYPSVYYTFANNMKALGLDRKVTPFPQTSQIAGRLLQKWEVKADLIYIDGSHEYDDVRSDLELYSTLLRSKGVIFGDDYHSGWPGVVRAVSEYVGELGDEIEDECDFEIRDRFWILRKK